MTVQPCLRDVQQSLSQPVPQSGEPCGADIHILCAVGKRLPKPHYPGKIFSACTPAALLFAAEHERRQPDPAADVKRAHPFRSVYLVS